MIKMKEPVKIKSIIINGTTTYKRKKEYKKRENKMMSLGIERLPLAHSLYPVPLNASVPDWLRSIWYQL
jgi:hypothetical protein